MTERNEPWPRYFVLGGQGGSAIVPARSPQEAVDEARKRGISFQIILGVWVEADEGSWK